MSPGHCMQEKALITRVKLAGCLQSALARHSQNLNIFHEMCWCLSTHFYVLAFGTLLLGFQHMSAGLLQPPDSAMDNVHLCTHTYICPEDRLSTFCFSHAHAAVQVHPLRNLSMGALQYECTGEISEKKGHLVWGREGGPATEDSQLKEAARNQGRSLIPCKEAVSPVLPQHPAHSLPSLVCSQ